MAMGLRTKNGLRGMIFNRMDLGEEGVHGELSDRISGSDAARIAVSDLIDLKSIHSVSRHRNPKEAARI
jgi:hypothetical protein